MNKNNRFSRFALFAFFSLSLCVGNNIFGMKQASQEITIEPSIEYSSDPSIVALKELTNNLKNSPSILDRIRDYTPLPEISQYLPIQPKTIREAAAQLTYNILIKAESLHKKGFYSFYHARNSNWAFFSDIVKVCTEKANGFPFSDETNFFMRNPEASKKFSTIHELLDASGYTDTAENFQPFGISANFLLIGNHAADECTITLMMNTYRTSTGPSINPEALFMWPHFKALIKRYNLEEKQKALLALYNKTFCSQPFPSRRLYHIALHRDEINRLVKLTKPYASKVLCIDQSPTDYLLSWMESTEKLKSLATHLNHHEDFDLFQLQARILVDYETFINPEKVKVYNNWLNFDQEAQDNYWKELRAICNDEN